ncbi:ATP-binding protein [Agarivorans sp. QJM3NY_29]|uniref:ATP-binding protein n=1 Tax=unclassified Agarivorans TaxID=2636026 RepID=UPI003D7CCA3D
MYKPNLRFPIKSSIAWRNSLLLLTILVSLAGCLWFSQSQNWQLSPRWVILVDLGILLSSFFISFLCRYYYRRSDSYFMLVFSLGFFTLSAIELCFFLVRYQLFFSFSVVSHSHLVIWAGLISRGCLAFILLTSGMLVHRLYRLANGGKMSPSVLIIASVSFALLSIAFLYVVSLPFMQSSLSYLQLPAEFAVSCAFVLLIVSYGVRLRWLSEPLEYGILIFTCIQFVLYFWAAPSQLAADNFMQLVIALSKLFSYLVVIAAVFLQAKSATPLNGGTRSLRRESRLIRLFERSRNRQYPWFVRVKNSLSSYVSLLSACLVVMGVASTSLIFYFAFVSSLENERKQQLSLHSSIQVEHLDRRIKLAYDEISLFSRRDVLVGFFQQQFIEGNFINIEPLFWKPWLRSNINKLFSRVPALRAVHLVVVAQGQQFDYLSVAKGKTPDSPKSLLLLAAQQPSVVHAQAIRENNDDVWSLAKAVTKSDGKVVAIWVFQYQQSSVFSLVLQEPPSYLADHGLSDSNGDDLLVFDVNGERLWRKEQVIAVNDEFQAAEYQRVKQLLASPVKNVAEQVIKYGSYLLSIQRLAYMPNNSQEYLDLVLVADYQRTIVGSKLAAKQALIVALIVMGFMVLFGWFFAHTIVSPLRYITHAMLLYGKRNLRVVLPEQSNDEVGVLASTISQMMAGIDKRAERLNSQLQSSRKNQQQLKLTQQKAKVSTRVKSDFLAMMSHEVRTPMDCIVNMTESLSSSPLSSEQMEYVNTIRLSSKALLAVVNDIFDYSKVEMETMALRLNTFNLKLTLSDVVQMFSLQAKEKHIQLRLDYPASLPSSFLGDQGKIQQIFINLVSNALRHTEVGHITLSVHLTEQSTLGEMVEISVSDSGVGISEEAQEDMFRSFAKSENLNHHCFADIGLGLMICQRLTSLMNGDVKIRSRLGLGTEVSIHLPLSSVDSYDQHSVKRTIVLERLYGQVLLIESDIVKQRIVSHVLNSFGLKVILANNGHEAIEMFKGWGTQLSLILINCQIADKSAFHASSVIRNLESNTQRIPIVGLTTDLNDEMKQVSIESGIDEMLIQPCEREVLYGCLSQWLGTNASAGRVIQSKT